MSGVLTDYNTINCSTEYNDTDESEEDNEIINNVQQQNLKITEVDLHNGQETQIGHQNIYHGPVDVHNFLQISSSGIPSSVNDNETFSRGGNLPNIVCYPPNAGFSQIQDSGDPITQLHSASVPPLQAVYFEYNRTASRGVINSEREPLIANKRENSGSLTYKLLLLTVFSLIVLSSTLTIIYGHRKPSKGPLPANFTHIFRTREQWGALQPKIVINLFKFDPPKFVVVGHTDSKPCNTSDLCSIYVRNIQAQQLAAQFDDIAYSFLIAGNGLIYEGRGWDEVTEATRGMGCSSLAVAFIGNFTEIVPPDRQINAFKLLLDAGESTGRIAQNYEMFMQSQIGNTISPGPPLAKILENWDHSRPFNKKKDYVCN